MQRKGGRMQVHTLVLSRPQHLHHILSTFNVSKATFLFLYHNPSNLSIRVPLQSRPCWPFLTSLFCRIAQLKFYYSDNSSYKSNHQSRTHGTIQLIPRSSSYPKRNIHFSLLFLFLIRYNVLDNALLSPQPK